MTSSTYSESTIYNNKSLFHYETPLTVQHRFPIIDSENQKKNFSLSNTLYECELLLAPLAFASFQQKSKKNVQSRFENSFRIRKFTGNRRNEGNVHTYAIDDEVGILYIVLRFLNDEYICHYYVREE